MSNVKKAISKILSDDALKKAFDNPIDFSKIMLDITPRWYQKLVLLDESNKKVMRMGRRVGKTASMIFKILFESYTNSDYKVLIIAPMKIQVAEIFEELRKLIKSNPILQNEVESSVKSPQTIKLKNGSRILGLTAGSSTGSGGSSARGQGANLIILDECDFLNEDDINSIMGTQLEDMGSVEIWSASTPTGARSSFYDWCTNAKTTYTVESYEDLKPIKINKKHSNEWVQFNFPSYVNPSWNEDMEKEMRSLFNEEGYKHEVLAEFGDDEAGVYKNEHIDDSIFEYKYQDIRDRKFQPLNRIRIIGVDWDLRVPTQIVVSEFNPEQERIQLIDRVSIEPSEFTFDRAVDKIKELNKKYRPKHIYVDRGYGEFQVETLKKKIGKKVKGIHFSTKIEVRDPFDGSIDKKEVKTFMVTQTSILLERGQLMFSRYDEHLIKELRNYRITGYSSKGKPIYNKDNEHSHDAFALTVLAFNREFPELAKLIDKFKYATDIDFIDKRIGDIGNILGGEKEKDKNVYGFDEEQAEKMKGEPHYVKHMMSIEFNRQKGGRSAVTWGSRGDGDNRSPGRNSF